MFDVAYAQTVLTDGRLRIHEENERGWALPAHAVGVAVKSRPPDTQRVCVSEEFGPAES